MRFLFVLFFLADFVFAASNAITVKNTSASTLVDRVVTISRPFVKDEICDYPQPYVTGIAASIWQVDHVNRWPVSATCASGSVKSATISWRNTYAGTSTVTVDFRSNSNPCSSGNQAACNAAALDEAGMLAYDGGTWQSSLIVTPNPAGTASVQTIDARTVLDSGAFEYYLRGPAITQVVAGDKTSARANDFGWSDWKHNRINTAGGGLILSTDTSITVLNGAKWATLPRPFTINIDSEHIQICYVSGNVLTVGTTNGASAACATTAGRGVNGTTATFHSFLTNGNWARLVEATPMYLASAAAGSATTLTLNDATSINSETILQVAGEQIRVCARSGNTLTVGTGAWGCAANATGRNWSGTNPYGNITSNSHLINTPVYNLTTGVDRWYDAPANEFKSLHPEIVLTFPKYSAGVTSVGVYYILWNDYLTAQQDQEYDVQVTIGASTVYTQTEIRHIAHTALRFPVYNQNDSQYWTGTAPGFLRINHNHTYLALTGAVQFDPTVTVNSTFTDSLLVNNFNTSGGQEPAWNGGNNDKCVADTKTTLNGSWSYVKGSLLRQLNTPGGRPDIGPLSLWDVSYLYGMALDTATSDSLEEMSKSMLSCMAQIPWFHRETSTGNFCDNGDYPANTSDKSCTGGNLSASAFGRFISIDLHPEACPMNQNTISTINDKFFASGPMSGNRFAVNTGAVSHISATFMPWLVTDDYFAYEITVRLGGAQFAASEFVTNSTSANPQERARSRQQDQGLMSHRDGTRQVAWSLRNWANSWFAARDSSPEKEYITSKINRNIAFWEGQYGLTTGNFYIPCPSPLAGQYNYSPWCFGNSLSNSPLTTTFPSEPYSGYLSEASHYSVVRNWNGESPWMRNYWLIAMADTDRKGFTNITPFRKYYTAGSQVQSILNPDWSFWFESYYRNPQTPCQPEGTDVSPNCASQSMTTNAAVWQYTSWANRKAAFTYPLSGPNVGGIPTNVASSTAETDMMSGYFQIAKAAIYLNQDADYSTTQLGKYARNVIDQNTRYKNNCANNPMWCPVINPTWTVTVTPGDTTVLFQGAPPSAGNCKISVSATVITNSDDSGDTACTYAGANLRHFTTGLTAATLYYYRITVNDKIRTYGTFTTTAAAGGATTVTLNLKAPAGYGTVADVVTEYGNTSSLGSSTTTSCASTCTVSVSGNAGRVIYYKNTWRNSTPTNLVSTTILSQMVQ